PTNFLHGTFGAPKTPSTSRYRHRTTGPIFMLKRTFKLLRVCPKDRHLETFARRENLPALYRSRLITSLRLIPSFASKASASSGIRGPSLSKFIAIRFSNRNRFGTPVPFWPTRSFLRTFHTPGGAVFERSLHERSSAYSAVQPALPSVCPCRS